MAVDEDRKAAAGSHGAHRPRPDESDGLGRDFRRQRGGLPLHLRNALPLANAVEGRHPQVGVPADLHAALRLALKAPDTGGAGDVSAATAALSARRTVVTAAAVECKTCSS